MGFSASTPQPLRAQPSCGGRIHTAEDVFGGLLMEALAHGYMITRLPCYGNPQKTSIYPGRESHPRDNKPEERMPRSPAGCRGQATSLGNQGIRRILQPRTASPGDWPEDSGGDPTPAGLADASKAHHTSGPQWIAPRPQARCVSRVSPEQPRTGFSASTGLSGTMAVVIITVWTFRSTTSSAYCAWTNLSSLSASSSVHVHACAGF